MSAQVILVSALTDTTSPFNRPALLGFVNGSSSQTNMREINALYEMPAAGTVRNLRVQTIAAPGGGNSWTWTITKNESTNGPSVTISNPDTSGEDLSTTLAFAVGDRIRIGTSDTGNPSATLFTLSYEFVPDVDNTSIYGAGHGILQISNVNTLFDGLFSGEFWASTSGLFDSSISLIEGTVTHYRVKLSVAPGSGNDRTFNILKNGVVQDGTGGTVDTTVVVADAATTGNASFSLAISPTDELRVRTVPNSTPASSAVGVTFAVVGDQPGQFSVETSIDSNGTWYVFPYGGHHASLQADTNEAERIAIAPPTSFTLSRMRARMDSDPGAGASMAITLRKNGAATALTGSIIGDTDTILDVAEPVTFVDGDTLSLQVVTTNITGDRDVMITIAIGELEPAESERNLLTGDTHTLDHSRDSAIFGATGTLTDSDRVVLMSLDGQANAYEGSGALVLFGDFIHSGGSFASSNPETFTSSIVTADGDVVVDDEGNVVVAV